MEELKRFEKDLNDSEELRKKLDETVRRIAAEGRAANDGEIMVMAAKELGYDISVIALEKALAEAEKLDPEELKTVAGGSGYTREERNEKYKCTVGYVFNGQVEDEHGHDGWCLTGWHCYAATLHTDTKEKQLVSCWSDYKCMLINE